MILDREFFPKNLTPLNQGKYMAAQQAQVETALQGHDRLSRSTEFTVFYGNKDKFVVHLMYFWLKLKKQHLL